MDKPKTVFIELTPEEKEELTKAKKATGIAINRIAKDGALKHARQLYRAKYEQRNY